LRKEAEKRGWKVGIRNSFIDEDDPFSRMEFEKTIPSGDKLRYSMKVNRRDSAKTRETGEMRMEAEIDFYVNNTFSTDRDLDPRVKRRLSLELARLNKIVRENAKDRTIFVATPYIADGRGEERREAYLKLGYGQAEEKRGVMYATIENGKMKPLNYKNTNNMDFSENRDLKLFYQILFGQKF